MWGRRIRELGGWAIAMMAMTALTACYEGSDPAMELSGGGSSSGGVDEGEPTPPPPGEDDATDSAAGSGDAGEESGTTGGAADVDSSGGEPETGEPGTTGGALPDTYEELDGIVAVEAEHAFEIDDNGTERSWYVFTADDEPQVDPDPDPPHWDSASGQSCLEGLPDTRVTHDDQLQGGVNFYGSPGDGPILRYRVWINEPGRYWVRVRAYSTGSEDNGVHVGLDGEWPASGARIQWCSGKNQWTWSGAQRTDANHCGEPNMIFLDIDEPGEHEIAFSMREDGFEMDKWMLTNDSSVFPEGAGPDEVPFEG